MADVSLLEQVPFPPQLGRPFQVDLHCHPLHSRTLIFQGGGRDLQTVCKSCSYFLFLSTTGILRQREIETCALAEMPKFCCIVQQFGSSLTCAKYSSRDEFFLLLQAVN